MPAPVYILNDNSGEPPLTLSADELHAELDRQLAAVEGDVSIDWHITLVPDLSTDFPTLLTQPIPLQ